MKKYKAYDTVTEWSGPYRETEEAAEADAARHNAGCERQGGYGSAIVVVHDGTGRCITTGGDYVWPPYGRGCGAVQW